MVKEINLEAHVRIFSCSYCDCIFQYEDEDIERQVDIWGGFDDYITCPVCGKDIYNAPGCRGRYD